MWKRFIKFFRRLFHIPLVVYVDGEWVRTHIAIDFIDDGNHGLYSRIPEGEIWIERGLSDQEKAACIKYEKEWMKAHGE